jgi:hypothetical protein
MEEALQLAKARIEREGLLVGTRSLSELLEAVEGLRGQLSVLSDTALSELELMKFWIQKAIDDGANAVVLAKVIE